MYTIDASVHVSALNSGEPNSETSQTALSLIQQHCISLFSPTLLVVEVAAAVSRALGDTERGVSLAAAVRDLPGQTLVPLDRELADRAAHMAATAGLRGADAVYAAVACEYGTTLVTLDRQQLERLPSEVRIARPADVLHELETR